MKSTSHWNVRQSIKKRIDGFYRSDCCVLDLKSDERGVFGTVIMVDKSGRAKRLCVTAKLSPTQVCEYATLWVESTASWSGGRSCAVRFFLNRTELDDFLAS